MKRLPWKWLIPAGIVAFIASAGVAFAFARSK